MNTWKVENSNRLLNEIKNKFLDNYTTKDLKWSIEHNRCFVNGSVERFCSTQLKRGDTLVVYPDKTPHFAREQARILFEDDDILIYNKPPYLASEILAEMVGASLAHRLDRDTTGVILLAKNPQALTALEAQFLKRTIRKEYLALVHGKAEKQGTISGKMAVAQKRQGAVLWKMANEGLPSQTHWKCLKHLENYSLLCCLPVTGRTHQIRVHLTHIGHPLVGDYTYGLKKPGPIFRPLLHAYRLMLVHPKTNQKITCVAPVPSDFPI